MTILAPGLSAIPTADLETSYPPKSV